MDFPIVFKQNKLCKNLRLKIDYKAMAVILVLPLRYSKTKALNFLKSNEAWVVEKLTSAPKKIVYKDKEIIEIIGKKYRIAFFQSPRRYSKINNDMLEIYGSENKIKDEVLKIAKCELLKYAYQKTDEFAKKINVSFNSITVKSLKSRYGSCSSKKNLNLSLVLAFAPLIVSEMVIAHETAHLKHMNHSKDFKKTLDFLYPKTYDADMWLKKNHKNLNCFV